MKDYIKKEVTTNTFAEKIVPQNWVLLDFLIVENNKDYIDEIANTLKKIKINGFQDFANISGVLLLVNALQKSIDNLEIDQNEYNHRYNIIVNYILYMIKLKYETKLKYNLLQNQIIGYGYNEKRNMFILIWKDDSIHKIEKKHIKISDNDLQRLLSGKLGVYTTNGVNIIK